MIITSFTIGSSKSDGAVALVSVVRADTRAAVLARSDDLAQIGLYFTVSTAETLFTLANVVTWLRARLGALAAVVARLALARARPTAILHVGRINYRIDQVDFHSLNFKLWI